MRTIQHSVMRAQVRVLMEYTLGPKTSFKVGRTISSRFRLCDAQENQECEGSELSS